MMCVDLLTQAMWKLLTTDSAVKAQLGNPVRLYEMATLPQGPVLPTFPYAIYTIDSTDLGEKDHAGEQLTITIHVFSQDGSFKSILAAANAIYDLLHENQAELQEQVEGLLVCQSRFAGSNQLRDSDGITLHGVYRFNVIAETTP